MININFKAGSGINCNSFNVSLRLVLNKLCSRLRLRLNQLMIFNKLLVNCTSQNTQLILNIRQILRNRKLRG